MGYIKILKIEFKTAAIVICFILTTIALRFWYLEEQGNFHPITPGEAYRSAQLDEDELEYYLNKFKIRSIINLRGKHIGELWYEEERRICKRLGVKHYDFRLSANKVPCLKKINKLLKLFQTAPRPVLIHCRAGADRSGLAAALWKIAIDGAPIWVAKKQLSIRYGHLPFGPTQVLDGFLDQWVKQKKLKIADLNKENL
jgi:undecaprenyl-diphosphatase